MENKPFIFGVATSGDNFTDREKETERLLLNFRHGVNTVLISPRRWGKDFVGAESVSFGAIRQVESRISRYFLVPQ